MAENAFVNTNRYPRNNYQNNEDEVNYKSSENDENPRKKRKKEKKKATADSASSSATNKKSIKKLFKSCGQCCNRKKRSRRTKPTFGEYIKKKSKKSRTKKRKDKQPDAVTGEYPENEEERIVSTKEAKRRRDKKKKKKEDPLDQPVASSIPVNQMQDITKACCYLCANNAMAIAAAAMADKIGKSDVSMQTSSKIKEMSTMDKGCHPMMYVRTVQSSVKVKTRDMGTLHPERKKIRRLNLKKHKLMLKRIRVNIMKNIQKIKLPSYPKVRTVACETNNPMGYNNIPQCRAMHGAHCATNA